MAEQFIFQIWRGANLMASCHSTNRDEALREAKELSPEFGSDCFILEKSSPSASLDRLYEQDCDPLTLSRPHQPAPEGK